MITARLRRAVTSLTVAVGLALSVAASASASGCAADRCVPRTGAWSAPSPQKLTSPYGPTTLTMGVRFRRGGKVVASRYGNTVKDFSVLLRYFCPKGGSTAWVQSGLLVTDPIAIGRDGRVKATIPAGPGHAAHTLTIRFTRTSFTGRLSGTAKSFAGETCSTAVSFSGKLRR